MSDLFMKSSTGRRAFRLPSSEGFAAHDLPEHILRKKDAGLPELDELGILRHFVDLSVKNHSIARGFYPLGSCTMKYNPVLSEQLAADPGFAGCHPAQEEESLQGSLQMMKDLEEALLEITGFAALSLQPSAGAQGEFAGMLMARAWHEDRGEKRDKVLIPDSAHGTNPATVRMAGMNTIVIPSTEEGLVDLEALDRELGDDTAAVMLTNPNTLGLFEKDIREIADRVHEAGALLYMDGANMNALLGRVRPADIGFDILHLNLHKTFATPHGGGGPGAGPVAVCEKLMDYLPGRRVRESEGRLEFFIPEKSIGDLHSWYGNAGICLRALAYILRVGGDGMKDISAAAVLNANYLQMKLRGILDMPREGLCMHEFVASGSFLRKHDLRTLDLAKRLLDFGMHAPTIYFPLIVPEALMIEPTETETLETLDEFVRVIRQIAEEARENPELLREAPHETPVGRLDETRAARHLCLVSQACGSRDPEAGEVSP
ncbi:MAG: aminomethyl-transferring glycine dehydrogenase subunit GcvPB [Candidatus Krumholzibacteria bacterium]|nr:aminomethyl-transferring glycine dehydrogenase subunit GcvPB [Candidatus Krumholzibacteria bacterium]MDP7021182.1 aminomethyl-transferring glycine dehydrogenase subunit GcvPB [Candidatus Krumholzibacteria bacterium]